MKGLLRPRGARLSRPRALLVAGVLIALSAAGAAYAEHATSSLGAVSGTFSATTASGSTDTQTCTASNGDSVTETRGEYTGTASSSDAYLNGALTIRYESVYDTTSKEGTLDAELSIDNSTTSPADEFRGELNAVDSNGTLQGVVSGEGSGGESLLANLSASFSSSSGFSSSSAPGTIGSGSATDTAVQTTSSCSPQGSSGGSWASGGGFGPSAGFGNGSGFSGIGPAARGGGFGSFDGRRR